MEEKGKPLVSVVIPTLNEEKYLPRSLESLCNQTFKNFEIIVSDGGSEDKTVEIAKKYGAKVIVNKDSTVTVARQKGIEIAKGEIIVGADADTIYPPSHLQTIVDHFQKNPKLVAVGGGGIFEDRPRWLKISWQVIYFIFGKIFQFFGVALYIPAFNLSFRKDVFLKIGGYKTYLDYGGDELDILERLRKVGPVYFDKNLSPHPSSRRANEGFFKLIIKHTLIDYYLSYFLAKIFKKTVIRGKGVR